MTRRAAFLIWIALLSAWMQIFAPMAAHASSTTSQSRAGHISFSMAMMGLVLLLGLYMPMFGLSLILVLFLDAALLRRVAVLSRWLVLKPRADA